jgi:3-oxoacyl-[acyl-carrier protein] reductase
MTSGNPVAVITGCGRGIGRGIALELAKNGFDILGNDILYDPGNKKEGLEEVKNKALGCGIRFIPVRGDAASLEDQDTIIRTAMESFGRIDVLVNNAGIAPEKRMDILETTPDNYDRVLEVNTRGPLFLTQKAVSEMIKTVPKTPDHHRCILFITSVSAVFSSPSRAEYCISKAALSHLARIFAHRLAEENINVYEVRPGIIQTEMTRPVQEKYTTLISRGFVPQKRWGLPEDVGKAVAALAKGTFAFSTGAIFEVSGGMNIRRL